MKLEKEIKQKSFNSEYQKLIVNILYTFFWMKERNSKILKPYGITLQQYNVLRILRGQHPNGITTSDIRSRMLDKMSDTSRLVDRLTTNGLVEKKVNPEDRRLVVVKISDKGLSVLEKIMLEQGTIDNLAEKLEESEVKFMNELLDKLRD